jgi:drug/metabolite transporter (DMT)-like permease
VKRAGFAAVSAAAVLWAAGGTYASRLIHEGASFLELTEARAWGTALILLAVAGIRRPSAGTKHVNPLLVVVFGCSIAGANVSYYASLSRLPVAIAITVQYTAPGLVVLWAAVAEGRRPGGRVLASLAAAVVGVALLSELPSAIRSGHLRVDAAGLVLSVVAAFAFATYMVTGEHVARAIGSQRSVLRGFCVAAVLWIVVQAARGRPSTLLDARFWPGIAFLVVATTIAPFLLFVWGLERVRASDAGIVSTLEPLTAALLAFVWLGQSLSAVQIVGGLLVVVAIGVVQVERPVRDEVTGAVG